MQCTSFNRLVFPTHYLVYICINFAFLGKCSKPEWHAEINYYDIIIIQLLS